MCARSFPKLPLLLAVIAIIVFLPSSEHMWAQATIATGNIEGTITDPSGAVISGAKITVTNLDTQGRIELISSSGGRFQCGMLIPGEYAVRVTNPGFQTVELTATVQVGTTTPANIALRVGGVTETIVVTGSTVKVNTDQALIQGVMTEDQIALLPFNGRNVLDLAQLEPGSQIRDAADFDPTKGGFTGISLGGRSGRSTRVELDSQDISDENVGTTVSNVPASGIQEFQIAQSTLDPSTGLTSSGAVNVVTRSGSKDFHGEAFYLFRDEALSASSPIGALPYQRDHIGGRFGGPIRKNSLFFFVAAEHIKQDMVFPVVISKPLDKYGSGVATPFRESVGVARLDWQLVPNMRLFYRFNYDHNRSVNNSAFSSYSNNNNAPSHLVGLDFNAGPWTHSTRIGYLKFANRLGDAGSPVNVLPGALVTVGDFRSGPNDLTPQATFQSNWQFKYDGSWMHGSHLLRYGVSFTRIREGLFMSLTGLGPELSSSVSASRVSFATDSCDPDANMKNGADLTDGLQPCFSGGGTNPLNYPVRQIVMGNGQGYMGGDPAFGMPSGGQTDHRLQMYIGDAWKIKPNLTLSYSLGYFRDTGRTNSDLPPIPCTAINVSGFSPSPTTCSDYILNMWGSGLANRVRQDNNNLAPAIAVAWDPWRSGKTAFRAGAGVYYDNVLFNNTVLLRAALLPTGLFNENPSLCPTGVVFFPGGQAIDQTPGGLDLKTQVCGRATGQVGAEVIALQHQYQAAVAAAGPESNPNFIGENLTPVYASGSSLLAPNFRTPYSYQMNAGVQHAFWPDGVLSLDYVRNVNLHYPLGIDVNHTGDARYLNLKAAQNAIIATNTNVQFRCGATDIDCAIGRGATITDYAGNGLTSGCFLFGCTPSALNGIPPDVGAAFPGVNPEVGSNLMLFPIGRSVYHALQVSFRQRAPNPLPGIRHLNLQISYALSRFKAMSGSQDFLSAAADSANPARYFGPVSYDRTHQLSVGAIVEFAKIARMSVIQHLRSPLPDAMRAVALYDVDEIFHSDLTGDGTVGDPLPGTNLGAFGRDVPVNKVNDVIRSYNHDVAGHLTPAGWALVNAGLFTEGQLLRLRAYPNPIPLAPKGQVGNGWLNTTDLRVAFPLKVGERVGIEPTVSFYNLLNVANFNSNPGARLGQEMSGEPGSINGTTAADRRPFQAVQSPSLYGLGAPRQIEFSLRITF